MKTGHILLATALSLPFAIHAAEGTPASKPPTTPAKSADAKPKKLKSFSEFGDELGKVGSRIGKGTVHAGKSAGAKISHDVKTKNFKARNAPPPEPGVHDRGGTN